MGPGFKEVQTSVWGVCVRNEVSQQRLKNLCSSKPVHNCFPVSPSQQACGSRAIRELRGLLGSETGQYLLLFRTVFSPPATDSILTEAYIYIFKTRDWDSDNYCTFLKMSIC